MIKKQKFFSLPDRELAENLILVFGFCEKQTRDKSKSVSKFVEIIVMIIFV